MEKLSVIIPTKNEAHNITEVLASVAFADEILIVDSFSTDETLTLAQHFDVHIIQRPFDYPAAQKNWAIPQATYEWILLVDADERITPGLQKEIQEVLKKGSDYAGYWIYRENSFMGYPLKNSGIKGDKCIRLFRKSLCKYEDKFVHEEIITEGKVGKLQHKMRHNTYVDLDNFYAKMNRYATWQADDYESKVKKVSLYHLWLKPNFRFLKHYLFGCGFRDGFAGYVYALTQKHAVKMRYIKLKMKQKGIK